jgi:hypothetical protein
MTIARILTVACVLLMFSPAAFAGEEGAAEGPTLYERMGG